MVNPVRPARAEGRHGAGRFKGEHGAKYFYIQTEGRVEG